MYESLNTHTTKIIMFPGKWNHITQKVSRHSSDSFEIFVVTVTPPPPFSLRLFASPTNPSNSNLNPPFNWFRTIWNAQQFHVVNKLLLCFFCANFHFSQSNYLPQYNTWFTLHPLFATCFEWNLKKYTKNVLQLISVRSLY